MRQSGHRAWTQKVREEPAFHATVVAGPGYRHSFGQLAGFATGESLTIVLDSFTDPTGIATPIAAQRPADVTAKTWMVMNQFLEYLKRDGRDLPLSEFPLLT